MTDKGMVAWPYIKSWWRYDSNEYRKIQYFSPYHVRFIESNPKSHFNSFSTRDGMFLLRSSTMVKMNARKCMALWELYVELTIQSVS